jgi:hypothetical protein
VAPIVQATRQLGPEIRQPNLCLIDHVGKDRCLRPKYFLNHRTATFASVLGDPASIGSVNTPEFAVVAYIDESITSR